MYLAAENPPIPNVLFVISSDGRGIFMLYSVQTLSTTLEFNNSKSLWGFEGFHFG